MSDVNCPYCGTEQEINHDDGYGYEEDEKHEQQCGSCEKNFSFTTSIYYHYEASKADCLNDGQHNYKPTMTVPRVYTRMECSDCGETRDCNEAEKAKLGYWD